MRRPRRLSRHRYVQPPFFEIIPSLLLLTTLKCRWGRGSDLTLEGTLGDMQRGPIVTISEYAKMRCGCRLLRLCGCTRLQWTLCGSTRSRRVHSLLRGLAMRPDHKLLGTVLFRFIEYSCTIFYTIYSVIYVHLLLIYLIKKKKSGGLRRYDTIRYDTRAEAQNRKTKAIKGKRN